MNLEGASGGGDGQMDRWMGHTYSPCFLQDFVPFGSLRGRCSKSIFHHPLLLSKRFIEILLCLKQQDSNQHGQRKQSYPPTYLSSTESVLQRQKAPLVLLDFLCQSFLHHLVITPMIASKLLPFAQFLTQECIKVDSLSHCLVFYLEMVKKTISHAQFKIQGMKIEVEYIDKA